MSAPYHNADLYHIGGAPNFTAVVEEGLATCESELVFSNSILGTSGDPIERMFAAFSERCPGLSGLSSAGVSPEDNLAYECGEDCVNWLLNYGACSVTDHQAVCSQLPFQCH